MKRWRYAVTGEWGSSPPPSWCYTYSSRRWADAPLLRAPENLLDTRAPYLFEPVLALHPGAHLAMFLSPLNLLLGTIVAALAGANVAVTSHTAQHSACRRRGYGRLLGVLPAFPLGFACCAPTLLFVLGTAPARRSFRCCSRCARSSIRSPSRC